MILFISITHNYSGRFYWEIHEDLGLEVVELFKNKPFDQIELIEDIYGRNRMVKARWLG